MMTETEYIYATNLAKVRVLKTILLDSFPLEDKEKNLEIKIFALLDKLEDIYSKKSPINDL